jgi:hypothetical protein
MTTTLEKTMTAFLLLWIISIGVQLLLHWLMICPALYRHGQRFPTGFLPWRVFRELRIYRSLLTAEARSLNRYYLYLLLFWFNILLGLVLGLLVLWDHTSIADPALR